MMPYLFPPEVAEYFEVKEVKEESGQLYVHLDERSTPPRAGLESKGFYPGKMIQDFPLRERAVFLVIRRRRWRDKATREEITRDYKLEAQGTKYTKEFANFLKEVFGK